MGEGVDATKMMKINQSYHLQGSLANHPPQDFSITKKGTDSLKTQMGARLYTKKTQTKNCAEDSIESTKNGKPLLFFVSFLFLLSTFLQCFTS